MKVFFDHEILSFWSYEKPSWKNVFAFYHITVPKSNCHLNQWSSVMFQKNKSLGARKEKLVREASHLSSMKNAAWKKKIVVYGNKDV